MSEPARAENDTAVSAKAKDGDGVFETIKVVFQALLIALVVRTFLFQPFNIPSGSLIPTLEIGDYLFVSKYSYGYSRSSFPCDFIYFNICNERWFSGRVMESTPKRGDIAVFRLPRDPTQDYIKRVIGLPGDTVYMSGGRLYINNVIVPREEITKAHTTDFFGKESDVPTYKETLPDDKMAPGVSHRIIELQGDNGVLDNTEKFVVPAGHYFMMGDNRDNSTDSRVPADAKQAGVGYVPIENFVGRAELVFFSLKPGAAVWEFWKWPTSIRWSRMFQPVR